MELWLPLGSTMDRDVASLSVKDQKLQGRSVRAVCAKPPTSGKELPNTDERQISISARVAASFGLPVIAAKGTVEWRSLVAEQMKFAECQAEDGTRLRYGASVRLVVQFASREADLKLTLPAIAAAAELGQAEAQVYLSVVGFPPGIPEDLQLAWEPLSVKNYSEVVSKAGKLRSHVFAHVDDIVPDRLGVIDDNSSTGGIGSAVGRVWAAGQIADGRSCQEATRSLPKDLMSPEVEEGINAAYREYAGQDSCSGDRPDPVAQARASVAIGSFRLGRRLFS